MVSGSEELSVRELLGKAFEKLAPAVAYLVSPQAGFAVSVAVFATWTLSRIRGARSLGGSLDEERAVLVDLSARIDEKKRRIRLLEEEMANARDDNARRMIQRVLEAERSVLASLVEEYELRQLRIIALDKLREVGGEEVYGKVWELLRKIEEGRRFEEEQLEVMRALEDKWRKRLLETNVVLQVLNY